MLEVIEDFIAQLKQRSGLKEYDEARTKQAIILPLLQKLNWDPFNVDEVTPEFSVGSQRVDYCLRFDKSNKVFLEVKKCESDLEQHQEQILNYSFKEGVELAILTNGIIWWFYLPLKRGSWDQRKFYTIDIYHQEVKEISKFFKDILSNESIINETAIKNAESIHQDKYKLTVIKDSLPEIWDNLVREPNELLVELIVDEAERKTGYKPEVSFIKAFLKQLDRNLILPSPKRNLNEKNIVQKVAQDNSNTSKNEKELKSNFQDSKLLDSEINYKGTKPLYFIFNDKKYNANNWIDVQKRLCRILALEHKNEFSKILNIKGKKRKYFSKVPQDIFREKGKSIDTVWKIEGSNIYMDTNMSANTIVATCKTIVKSFGYSESSFDVIVSNR